MDRVHSTPKRKDNVAFSVSSRVATFAKKDENSVHYSVSRGPFLGLLVATVFFPARKAYGEFTSLMPRVKRSAVRLPGAVTEGVSPCSVFDVPIA